MLATLLCSATSTLALTTAAHAQIAPTEDTTEGGGIVVTGSRIASQNVESMSPMSVVGEEELTLTGTATMETLLNTLPQVVPGEGAFTNNETSAAATMDLRGLGPQRNLILVNGRRFVFFDARQIVDVNTIPTALVERVELITGGSSAVYGSDAVSGVVNFILKDDMDGLEVSSQYDITAAGDSARFNLDIVGGANFAEGRGNVTLFYNYYNRDDTFADARGRSACFLEDTTIDGSPALACGGSAGIPNGRIAGLPAGAALTGRPGVQSALASLGLNNLTSNGFKFDETGQQVSPFVVPGDRYNFNPDNYLQLPLVRNQFGGMAHYEVTPGIEAYFEGLYSSNRTKTQYAATPVTGSYSIQVDSPFLTPGLQNLFRALDASEGTVQLDANNNPVLGADGLPVIIPAATRNDGYTTVSIGRRISEGPTRNATYDRDAYRFVGGLRGDIGSLSENAFTDLQWDAYYSYAKSKNTLTSTGNIVASRYAQGVTTAFDSSGNLVCADQSNGCVPLNIFGPNISPEGIDFITERQVSTYETTMKVAQASVTGTVVELPAGPLGFAAGFEWREVTAAFNPATGSVGQVGEPTYGEYDVKEFFGELRIPVFYGFELNGAFRYSDYSLDNVKGVWTYGGGATWQVVDSLRLRGQYQRAVRAPSVNELFSAQSRVSEAASDPCALASAASDSAIRALCVATGVPNGIVGTSGVQPSFQVSGIVGGNPDLEEESTDTYTVGAVFEPIPRLAITVDYYNITVNDAIARLGGSINNVFDLCYNQVQDADSPYCRSIIRQDDGTIGTGTNAAGQDSGVSVLFANIGKIKTDGIDVGVSYTMPLGMLAGSDSTLNIATTANWLNSFDVTSVAALPDRVNECAGTFGLTCGEPMPEFKANTRLTLKVGRLTTSIRWRYQGKVTDDRVTRGVVDASVLPVPKIDPENYFDFSFDYDLDKYTLYGGILNMFDNHQQLLGSAQEQLNTYPSTYDPLGIRFFMGAKLKF
ncbi:TonB-dependent receptor [Novosphingobium sp. PC22D]|uniref:TonB-dependent receptor domain-containing protein n=1 Tax=Novosphingobium sp. PC22D TaxID=1962403 RepID=UPI001439478D|nr:TonB-dependent receptor [Novosphingobium sp. PC22D]